MELVIKSATLFFSCDSLLAKGVLLYRYVCFIVMTNLPTIKEFLKSNQLDQYHDAFIKTGATEQDLELVIQLNEQELSEFISALGMLPFHSIKFKKSLRELRNKLSPVSNDSKMTSNLFTFSC